MALLCCLLAISVSAKNLKWVDEEIIDDIGDFGDDLDGDDDTMLLETEDEFFFDPHQNFRPLCRTGCRLVPLRFRRACKLFCRILGR